MRPTKIKPSGYPVIIVLSARMTSPITLLNAELFIILQESKIQNKITNSKSRTTTKTTDPK